MDFERCAFLLFVTLAAAASAPAVGQAFGPASSGTQSATAIPDFSGVWAHPSAQSGFEP
jgi:hypothetical protein